MNYFRPSIILFIVMVVVAHAKQSRPSSIRTDLKALIRYTKMEINVFVDTSISSGEFEKVLLNLYPAVDILRLKMHDDIRLRYVLSSYDDHCCLVLQLFSVAFALLHTHSHTVPIVSFNACTCAQISYLHDKLFMLYALVQQARQ
jgi:hypothetical protein